MFGARETLLRGRRSGIARFVGDPKAHRQRIAREVADLVQRWNLHWQQTSKYAICIEHMQRCLLS